MGNRKRISLAILLLVAALVLSMGTAYARYREEILAELNFQVKPIESLTLAKQEWVRMDDGSYVLTFAMAQEAQNCRVYLAVSKGVTMPENLVVTLTLPPETTEEDSEQEEVQEEPTEGELAVEPIVLTATVEEIPGVSALSALFGSGYVYRFLDEEADDETREELSFDLTTGDYILTVSGLEAAADTTSLLRLFVEYAQ